MRNHAAAFVFCLCLCLGVPSQVRPARTSGIIRGTVVDERGALVSDATVEVKPLGKLLATMLPQVKTDPHGRFVIQRLPWGKYGVFAMKEGVGYPNLGFRFYSNNVFPKVTLSAADPDAHLRIRLGPKAGVLTGRVTDAVSGRPVNANFKLVKAAAPHDWLSESQPSSFRVLLPASTTVNVEVSAHGYKSAHYPGLNLASGAEMVLDVRLTPVIGSSTQRK
jgi:hypothetical protein